MSIRRNVSFSQTKCIISIPFHGVCISVIRYANYVTSSYTLSSGAGSAINTFGTVVNQYPITTLTSDGVVV